MTTTATDSPPPASGPRPGALRFGLAFLAAAELVGALSDLSALTYDYGPQAGFLKFAQAATSVRIVLAPLLAGAALVFAVMGRLPRAIMALAALILVVWLSELTSIPIHGFELSLNLPGVFIFAGLVIHPVLAAIAIRLAWRGERLVLAAVLVAVPMMLRWVGVLLFAIGIAIYGF